MTDLYPERERIASREVLAARLATMADDPRGPEAHFGTFWFDSPLPPDLDPSSPEYRNAVMAQFRAITGKTFVEQPRGMAFDSATVRALAETPWPFSTGSAGQVGVVFSGIGHVLVQMNARAGHRCLVVGAEWGHLTLALARLGCQTTAVAVDERYATLLEETSRRAACPFRVVSGPTSDLAALLRGERFDFVVFRAALCECDDPAAAMTTVRDHLLAPGGRFVMVGEPLLESLPYPWGLDPFADGIWIACRHGRLRLTFRPSALLAMLHSAGFDAGLNVCATTSSGNTVVATRRLPIDIFEARQPHGGIATHLVMPNPT